MAWEEQLPGTMSLGVMGSRGQQGDVSLWSEHDQNQPLVEPMAQPLIPAPRQS